MLFPAFSNRSKGAINICRTGFLFSTRRMPMSGISGSCGKYMFNFIKKYSIVFQSIILHSQMFCMRFPVTHILMVVILLLLAILIGV